MQTPAGRCSRISSPAANASPLAMRRGRRAGEEKQAHGFLDRAKRHRLAGAEFQPRRRGGDAESFRRQVTAGDVILKQP
jgi:hypothetical protein